MRQIMVYLEGGGNSSAEQAQLRLGFDAFFRLQKNAAASKKIGLCFVCCGGRAAAYKRFFNEYQQATQDRKCVLVVDSEDRIEPEVKRLGSPEAPDAKEVLQKENAKARKDHLVQREPWDLSGIPPRRIHLMTCCMETWIVADGDALAAYYGSRFHGSKLPDAPNLETVPKLDIYAKLAKATKDTQKGVYAKIEHASKLLARINQAKVMGRCQCFADLVGWLDQLIADWNE